MCTQIVMCTQKFIGACPGILERRAMHGYYGFPIL
jgi:hypothetical protein